jgi:hypothetical protein
VSSDSLGSLFSDSLGSLSFYFGEVDSEISLQLGRFLNLIHKLDG